jgi:DNA repair exonuclease SbcCD ATPase subunit
MRLNSVQARDFMGWENLDLDLSGVRSVVVVGKNNSGKSSLLDTFTWCCYDRIERDIASADSLIRDGTDSAYVRWEFDSNGKDVVVEREKQRGKTGALTLTVDGVQDTHHKQSETFAEIAKLIGLPYDALMAGPFMLQEMGAALMKLKPAERKELLVREFGLGRYEPLHEEAKKRRNAAEGRAQAAEAMVKTLTERAATEGAVVEDAALAREQLGIYTDAQSLAATRVTAIKELLAADRVTAERAGAILTRQQRLSDRLNANSLEHARAKGVIERAEEFLGLPAPAPADEAQVAVLEALEETAREEANRASTLATRLTSLEETAERLQKARANRAKVPCHAEGIYAACPLLTSVPSEDKVALAVAESAACAEEWGTLRGADVRYAQVRRDAAALRGAASTSREYTIRLKSATDAVAEARRTVETLASEASELMGFIMETKTEGEKAAAAQAAVETRTEELVAAEQTYQQARTKADEWATNLHAFEAAQARIDQAKADLVTWQATAVKEATEARHYSTLAAAFHRDGIPTMELASGIRTMEHEANEVLKGLPGDFSLRLRTERENQKGAITDTLDVVVTINGWEREYGLLSVGARFRVDLALRLGLARVLTHRTGGSIETLWLDEPLAALDDEGQEAVTETLAALEDQFGLIIVVSHRADFNDKFPARIDISMEDGVSSARLVA